MGFLPSLHGVSLPHLLSSLYPGNWVVSAAYFDDTRVLGSGRGAASSRRLPRCSTCLPVQSKVLTQEPIASPGVGLAPCLSRC